MEYFIDIKSIWGGLRYKLPLYKNLKSLHLVHLSRNFARTFLALKIPKSKKTTVLTFFGKNYFLYFTYKNISRKHFRKCFFVSRRSLICLANIIPSNFAKIFSNAVPNLPKKKILSKKPF